MVSYFGAELCDLIGLYILNHLKNLYDPKQIGLYRIEGLDIKKRINKQQLERLRKNTIPSFKSIGFDITIFVGTMDVAWLIFLRICKNRNLV